MSEGVLEGGLEGVLEGGEACDTAMAVVWEEVALSVVPGERDLQ